MVLNIHFDLIEPRADLDVLMVAPKGPGHTVRVGIQARRRCALSRRGSRATLPATRMTSRFPMGIGDRRRPRGPNQNDLPGRMQTDLFGEQVVLCGGLVELIRGGFDTLVEAGYAPEMAYFECLHEVKPSSICIHEGGIATMNYSVSEHRRIWRICHPARASCRRKPRPK